MTYKDYGWSQAEYDAHRYLMPTIIRAIQDSAIPKQATILDAGCGGGYVLGELHENGYQDVYGFDISESGITVGKKTYEYLKERYAIHDGYEATLPASFPQGAYDLVVSAEVVEHLYDPVRYLINIYQWLKSGGQVIVTTPYHGYVKNIIMVMANKFDQHVNPLWTGGHIKFFSQKTLSQLLTQAGFTCVRCYGAGRFPYVWKSMVMVGRK
jgi:2-polyprenyl-3-methyl-5-hydroxy-6-metoxy-1,4-benzoquinol methylase